MRESGSMRVLLVEDEVGYRYTVERALRKAGHVADGVGTVKQAMDKLRAGPYDVVVCDLKLPGGDGGDLIQWLGTFSPSTRIVVVSGFIDDDVRAQWKGTSVRLLDKPVTQDELTAELERIGPRRGFYGSSIEVELFDYVQMVALSGRDKLVEVTTPAGVGHVWIEHGDVCHTNYAGLEGEEGFYKMLAAGRGAFREVFYRDAPKRSILGSSMSLLMEAARRTDEGILDPTSPPKASAGKVSPATADDAEQSFADMSDDDDAEPMEIGESAPIDLADIAAIGIPDDDDDGQAVAAAAASAVASASGTAPAPGPAASASMSSGALGEAALEDPETRALMLEQFFQFDGVDGAAIVSQTGRVLAEDMRGNGQMVTLAGFYMRGAARIARALGYNVFDSVIARATTGSQLLIVAMGTTHGVLAVDRETDPEEVRDQLLGVDG